LTSLESEGLFLDKDRDKLTADYQANLRKNEQETSEVIAQKKVLEEKRQKLFEFKQRDMAYYNQLRAELYGDGAKQDLKMIDHLFDETGHLCHRTEQEFEQEAFEIERRKKQLSSQKDVLQSDYRRAMQSFE